MRIFEVAPAPSAIAIARAWINKVYAQFPQTWDNNHVMDMGGEGANQQFALFELIPSSDKRGAVEIKWFQAYPQRQGVGTRAMQVLQDMAHEDGITLTLFPWKHGRVSQSSLKKFYKKAGYKPINKGSDTMLWEPVTEAFDKTYPWKWTAKADWSWVAKFKDVVVTAHIDPTETAWEIKFTRNGTMGVTGEGDQFGIFATVLDIVKDFVKQMNPKVVTFSAEKEDPSTKSTSRPKLYSRMVRTFANQYGYDFKERSQYDDYVDYILIKKKDESVAENMDHSRDDQAVPELRAALEKRKAELQSANDAQVYNKINKLMTRIAKSHGISGQKLHDMWVKKYGEVPDTWIIESYKQSVTEAFDQPYPWRWGDRSSQRMWTASFADVVVIFSVNGAGEWEVSFARNNKQSVTGEGDQFKIFATVIDIAKDFINLKRPKVIQFTAHKEETETASSRTKLYSAMVKRFANSLGYESQEKPFNDFIVYVLTKKQDESVAEAFDQPYKSKWAKGEFGDVDVLAKLPDGTNLSIMFNHFGDNEWGVEFHRNNSQELTGEGDAQKIFATVLNAIQKFVKKYKPESLNFTASKEVGPGQNRQSRAKLYDKMVQRYASAMGYEAYQEDHGVGVVYELTRLADVTENVADSVLEGPRDFADMKLDNNKIQQELDYFYTGHAPVNIGGRKDAGSLRGFNIVTFNKGKNTLMFLVNKDDTPVFYVAYRSVGNGVAIGNVRSNGAVRATEVYAYLVDKFGTLYSDTKQTTQGRKIWADLAKFYPNLSVTDVGNRLKATSNVKENFEENSAEKSSKATT